MKELPPIDELLILLRTHPRQLGNLTYGAPPDRLADRPSEREWSAVEVLGHLRACGDMWGGAIETILAEDHPTIRAMNPRTWIDRTDYLQLAFTSSFRAYVRQRRALLAALDALSPQEWTRGATVTGAGKPLELTVHHYVERMAIHERPHVKQVARVVGASRYSM